MNVQRTIEKNTKVWKYSRNGAKARLRRMLDAAIAFGGSEPWTHIDGGNEYGVFTYSVFGEYEIRKIEEVSLHTNCRKLFPLNPAVKIKDSTWNFEIDGRLDNGLEFWPARYEPWYYYPEKYEELWVFPYDEWESWVLPF